jgi:DNA repair exonuclease SbcCD ATPase subunit
VSGTGGQWVGDDWTIELRAREGLIGVRPEWVRTVSDAFADRADSDEGRETALISGRGLRTPEQALEIATRILGGLLGVDTVERELSRVASGQPAAPEEDDSAEESEGELQQIPALLRTRERELRELRADAIEVTGDLEFASMQWARERQDAETTLLAYRDRARELKSRLQELESKGREADCPTCARILEDRYDDVVGEMRDEWEAVVQDGSWWKRRREQLELKPEALRELEVGSIRLHAAIEECAEEIERLRARLPELARSGEGRASSVSDRSEVVDARGPVLEALRTELLDEAKELIVSRTGRYLNRLTAGYVLAVQLEGGRLRLVRSDDTTEPPRDARRAALVFAIRLALVDMCARHGLKVDTLILGDLVDRLSPEAGMRAIVLLRGMLSRVPRIIVGCGADLLESTPEFFDWVVEVERDDVGHLTLKARRGGVGHLRVH